MHMTKTIKTGLAATLLSVTGVAAASDAVLTSIDGVALVNTGESYVTAQADTSLVAGDRVMVMEGGSAVITYADGCAYTLDGTKVLTVSSHSPCDSGQTASQEMGKRYAQAAGAGAVPLWVPLVGAAGVTTGIILFDDDDGDISPQ